MSLCLCGPRRLRAVVRAGSVIRAASARWPRVPLSLCGSRSLCRGARAPSRRVSDSRSLSRMAPDAAESVRIAELVPWGPAPRRAESVIRAASAEWRRMPLSLCGSRSLCRGARAPSRRVSDSLSLSRVAPDAAESVRIAELVPWARAPSRRVSDPRSLSPTAPDAAEPARIAEVAGTQHRRRRHDEGRHPAGRRPSGIRNQAFAESLGLRTNRVSVCSSSMPLVSGMRSSTYTNDRAANRAYMP